MYGFRETTKCVLHNGAVAAGQTTVTPSAGVDVQGFESCSFLVAFGAITAGAATSIKVQQSDDDGVADAYSDLAGTSVTVADDDDGTLKVVEIIRPEKRYLKLIVSRATQNSVVDSIIAVLTNPRSAPVATQAEGETHLSPAEGTA